jgi:ABC-type multidrug transport system ATPase subunit
MTADTVRLDGATKSFAGRPVLVDQTLALGPGTATVVRGPSGAGKSTLLNVVAGYVALDSGTVQAPRRSLYLMQEELLFSELTVHENATVRAAGALDGDEPDEERLHAALVALGLSELGDTPVSLLSGGERRRVELAVALVADLDLVLLDEPTAGLDPRARHTVYDAIWRSCAGRTVLLVTHEDHVPGLPPSARQLTLADGRFA